LLQDGIARAGVLTGTLLDIGSGVGSLTFGLLEGAITHAIAVDASSAYNRGSGLNGGMAQPSLTSRRGPGLCLGSDGAGSLPCASIRLA
jgi:hypothetical protein